MRFSNSPGQARQRSGQVLCRVDRPCRHEHGEVAGVGESSERLAGIEQSLGIQCPADRSLHVQRPGALLAFEPGAAKPKANTPKCVAGPTASTVIVAWPVMELVAVSVAVTVGVPGVRRMT